jgi:catechol 2,3-dioxygenase-like lactoylglutathione lyase family enzyme
VANVVARAQAADFGGLGIERSLAVSGFMNIRVADIRACYELWRSRGAEFITEPKPKYGETRCYIRDPDGYIIEVGQSTRASLTAK